MSQNHTQKKSRFSKKNVLLIFLFSSLSFAQIALFQNCGKIETVSSITGSSHGDATYEWQLSNWTTCSYPSCANQTRTATCMKTLDGETTVETNSSLCGTQSESLSRACSLTVTQCGTPQGSCQNSGSPVCNSSGRLIQDRICSPSGATCSGGCPAIDVGSCPIQGSCVNSGTPTCVNGRLMQARTCSPSNATCTGGCPTIDVGSCGEEPTSGNLFVNPVASGTVDVTLHPQSAAPLNQSVNIVFGLPFPKGFVSSASNIRVLNGSGTEIPSFVTVMNNWRDFNNPSTVVSIRSVQIGISVTFTNRNPVTIRVQWGAQRTQNITNTFTPASTWTAITNGTNPNEFPASENIQEPRVYATLSPSWMSQSLLKTRFVALNEVSTYNWFDNQFMTHSNVAANQTGQITSSEPWLYDRAQTLFFAYFRSGNVDWLRRAHRAAQFYKNKIGSNGSFTLQNGDLKYVYGQSMLYDLILTGDTSLTAVIERTRQPSSGFTTNYSNSIGFWTERNAAYSLLASTAAFEATGAASDANRARALFNNFFAMQQNPINNWTRNGCTLHTKNQHDPSEAIPDVMCSPWMGALLSDAVWRYYILSLDNNALIFLADFADYIRRYALYTQSGLRLPYYGASSYGVSPIDGDREHTCDVMGAIVRGYWANEALGRNSAQILPEVQNLLASCQSNLTGTSNVSPPRKYSWWYGSNSDFSWLLSNLP